MYCKFCGKPLEGEKFSAASFGEGNFCCETCYEKYEKKDFGSETNGYGVLILSGDKGVAVPFEVKGENFFEAVVGENPEVVVSGLRKKYPILFDKEKKERNELATILARDNIAKGDSITGNALVVEDMDGDAVGLFSRQGAEKLAWLLNLAKGVAEKVTKSKDINEKG